MSLPLLKSRIRSLEECHDVLYHCLLAILKNVDSVFDRSATERGFVRDLFRFGTQLEDLDETEFWSDAPASTVLPDVESPKPKKKKKEDVVQPMPTAIQLPKTEEEKSSRSFVSLFIPRGIICSGRKNREERAVYEAASEFIVSGFEETDYVKALEEEDTVPPPVDDRRTRITWMAAKFLVTLCVVEGRWKVAAGVSTLFLDLSSSTPNLSVLKKWEHTIKHNELADFLTQRQKKQRLVVQESKEENSKEGKVWRHFADHLTSMIVEGSNDLSLAEASSLLTVSTVLLERLHTSVPKNQSVAVGLMTSALVTGFVANQSYDVLQQFAGTNKKNSNSWKDMYEISIQNANSLGLSNENVDKSR